MFDESEMGSEWRDDSMDLIELPNGRHVPVPIAKRLVGTAIVEVIPVSRRVRDNKFFYCVQCDQLQKQIADYPLPTMHPDYQPGMRITNGHSFLKCRVHNQDTAEDTQKKYDMLVRLILTGGYKMLRYIEARR